MFVEYVNGKYKRWKRINIYVVYMKKCIKEGFGVEESQFNVIFEQIVCLNCSKV